MSIIPFPTDPSRDISGPDASAQPQGPKPRDRRGELVTRAVALLRQHLSDPVTVATLSRLAGASERTLRAAFHEVVGLSPKQYAIAHRLRAARNALIAADPRTTTVTDIATAHGFFELGRFACRYRKTFGEAPSFTLHRIAAEWTTDIPLLPTRMAEQGH